MIDRLLLEKIPLAGIARVLKLSESWLQSDVNHRYDTVPRQVQVLPKSKAETVAIVTSGRSSICSPSWQKSIFRSMLPIVRLGSGAIGNAGHSS
ncbi:MAG TPA: hypothetical protein V6D34_06750 [Candidatus Sericytochromatia bacterium]